ncbi:TlpA family protein disulfide reductase [Undibacterium seohonense]|uniref:TlpA family protein disulfide reductase n=1 Tax=Undibacterium seohonense TaxID=1344950 RepID=A0ABR6X999_9BURK|nr:TlpA disulfide reductase family protein [Undibacterium seohonense]MBC3808889.1 TlpA family protein disulfide reductase [Undibacterium seohonense]
MNRRDFLQSVAVSSLALSGSVLAANEGKALSYNLLGTDVSGKKVQLKDYAGKTVLVSFFTFDCPVCTNDLKLMREFYVGNSNKKFILLGVNIDKNKKELDEYNEVTTLAYPKSQRFPSVWRNDPAHKDNFGIINTTPTHFVLNKQHQLVFKREGAFQGEDWDNLWLSLS